MNLVWYLLGCLPWFGVIASKVIAVHASDVPRQRPAALNNSPPPQTMKLFLVLVMCLSVAFGSNVKRIDHGLRVRAKPTVQKRAEAAPARSQRRNALAPQESEKRDHAARSYDRWILMNLV